MRRLFLPWLLLPLLCSGCRQDEAFSRALEIRDRSQIIGGQSALADLGDFVLENDRLRIGIPRRGNSVGPGVFGGSLIDADLRRSDAAHRAGGGLDQFTEMFPIANLAIPAVCSPERDKADSFCDFPSQALRPSVQVLCDGVTPCRTCHGRSECRESGAQIDLGQPENVDYADPDDPTRPGPAAPSEGAAVVRVLAQSGNYLEALALVSVASVKMRFRTRTDYILEPGARLVRIRTLLTEADIDGSALHPEAPVLELPPLRRSLALFGLLLGSNFFPTELPGMQPGIAGGDFLFFGDRLHIFAPGIGFDVYRDIRNKFALGVDPLNNPVAADFLAGVGEHVSYAVGSADPQGKYLLPIFSGAVTAGFTHGANCAAVCPGTPEQCANVVDCSRYGHFVFERLFSVGDGDVASAAEALYEARGVPLGRLRGRVVDGRNSGPISGAEVIAFARPNTEADCRPGGDPLRAWSGGPEDFREDCLQQRDYLGAVSHLRTDRRATDLPAGRFEGSLPAGRYFVLARKDYRPLSEVAAVEVSEGETTELALAIEPPARVTFEIRDEAGQRVPSKLTVGQCFPECAGRWAGACSVDEDCPRGACVESRCRIDDCPAGRFCDPDTSRCVPREPCADQGDCAITERCLDGRCVCQPTFQRLAALGEGGYPAGLGRYLYAADGTGEFEIEPGNYEVWASRGFEYGVDRRSFAARSGQQVQLGFQVRREVDTSGWVAGDFHVHGQNSYDAVVRHRDRVMNMAGEGVDVFATTDHDYITDLSPTIRELGMERWVTTVAGLELTTVELGHWLGFPLRYDEWREGERVREQGAIDWTGKYPQQLQDELHELGLGPPEDTVVISAHPRDSFFGYFDQYGLDPYDVSRITGSLFENFPGLENPLGDPRAFSGTFDGLELFNSKRFELIRTPTAGEIRDYNQARSAIQAQAAHGAEPAVIERELITLDRAYVKEMLRRTPAEQDAIWDSDGKGGCDLMTFCTTDEDCEVSERCDLVALACFRPCSGPADCGGAECQEGKCDPGWTPADAPCTSEEGVVDDWFRLLDSGVVRTGVGNSDSHQLFTQTEGGLPRNFVRLPAERAGGIEPIPLARAIKAGRVVASYGPFIEAWLGENGIGEVHTPIAGASSVPLRVRVQSPGWFDVDRVEVYRSGRLVHVFTAAGDELDPDSPADTSGLALPNPRPVNLDVTVDEPLPAADAWYVVIAMGLGGRDLSPVYSEHPYIKLQIGDILSRSFASVPLPFDISGASIPRVFRILPYAVANPVYLDVDGNGAYDAPHPTPAWADGATALRHAASAGVAPVGSGPLAPKTTDQRWRARQLDHFLRLVQRFDQGRVR